MCLSLNLVVHFLEWLHFLELKSPFCFLPSCLRVFDTFLKTISMYSYTSCIDDSIFFWKVFGLSVFLLTSAMLAPHFCCIAVACHFSKILRFLFAFSLCWIPVVSEFLPPPFSIYIFVLVKCMYPSIIFRKQERMKRCNFWDVFVVEKYLLPWCFFWSECRIPGWIYFSPFFNLDFFIYERRGREETLEHYSTLGIRWCWELTWCPWGLEMQVGVLIG